ncbi:ppGpp synthetase/RelA/SpoT-type nucleotidyltransferase [Clostridium beijerinckii]|nr:ppGpp synthetase/RelA/SpoT-type nucleotidyltransferase [Clostridium beijerinckii]NSA87576.1 ppGpp synthetase/RelA/SpoT-type nucleotidyltransferase [Clostridium beijerinckii]
MRNDSNVLKGDIMAMNDWKVFLMPYEQAVDELKVKLKSIRKEYRKKMNIHL